MRALALNSAGIAAASPGPLLDVRSVGARFGGVQALEDVSLAVAPNEICALIGPNGAGKTTLFNCVSRVYDVAGGSITFAGNVIHRRPRHEVIGLGIARTFQNVGLIPSLTVLENVLLGAHSAIRPGFLRPIFPGSAQQRRELAFCDNARQLLDWLGLAEYTERRTGELAFGTLKRVELARALLSGPRLLMLDEPANGLAHGEVDELAGLILDIRARFDVAVLLVEHHMQMVLSISDRVAVLHLGRLIAHGTPGEVRNDPRVIEAYLGGQP